MEIQLANQLSELAELHRHLTLFLQDQTLSSATRLAIELAFEEHFSNIIRHGFEDGADHWISVKMWMKERTFMAEFVEEGRPFDPTVFPTPDLTVPADRRPVGGLGVHLVRASMDGLRYERRNGKNVLTLWKQLDGDSASSDS